MTCKNVNCRQVSNGRRAARPEPASPARCYGYARVTVTVAEADEGQSLDVQTRQVEGYAKMIGVTLDPVFVERGRSPRRPSSRRRAARRPEAGRRGDHAEARPDVMRWLSRVSCRRPASGCT
jgi:hypothetical protein